MIPAEHLLEQIWNQLAGRARDPQQTELGDHVVLLPGFEGLVGADPAAPCCVHIMTGFQGNYCRRYDSVPVLARTFTCRCMLRGVFITAAACLVHGTQPIE